MELSPIALLYKGFLLTPQSMGGFVAAFWLPLTVINGMAGVGGVGETSSEKAHAHTGACRAGGSTRPTTAAVARSGATTISIVHT